MNKPPTNKAQPAQEPDAPSDTPRTEELRRRHVGQGWMPIEQMEELSKHARRLERELAEARHLNRLLQQDYREKQLAAMREALERIIEEDGRPMSMRVASSASIAKQALAQTKE